MNTIDLLRWTQALRGRCTVLAACMAMFTILAAPAAAQDGGEEDDFNLDWNTIDCGGGEADGVDEIKDIWNV